MKFYLSSKLPQEKETIGGFFKNAYDYLSSHIVNILNACLILIAGYVIAKLLCALINRLLKKTKVPQVAHPILVTLIKIAILTLTILFAGSALGIDVTGAVAIVSVVGLAVSLSVQDALRNFTGGLQIITTQPFNTGDYITVDDPLLCSGTVKEIGMVYTCLVTPDNRHIYIPNSKLATATITNYSAESKRRLDLVFSISYENDFNKAKEIVENVIKNNLYVLHNEDNIVRVSALSTSSVDIVARVWVHKENYWNLNFDMYEQVKAAFDAEGITIPYPQVVVTPKNDEKK